MEQSSGKAVWVGRVLSWLISLLFGFSAVMKIVGGPDLAEGLRHLELQPSLAVPLAILEISCVVVYLIPATAILGAILLTGYLGGAILTHVRVGDPVYIHIVLGVLLWFAIWLRDPRLKALIPLRKG